MALLPQVNSNGAESVVFCGAMGTGKSNIALFLIKLYKSAVIVDAKNEILIPEWERVKTLKDLISSKQPRQIFAPTDKELEWLIEESFEPFYKWLYLREATACLIDENNFINRTSNNPQYWQLACYTRGRSKRISMLTCTQRPANLPIVVFTEAMHLWTGRLISDTDRLRVFQYSGIKPERITALQDYHFLHSYKGKPDKQVYIFPKQ